MKKWRKAPPELVDSLALRMKSVKCEYRKMFGYPAYFVNGNMFTGIFEDSLFIRLSESDIKSIRGQHADVSLFEPIHGRVMKDYVVLPCSFYKDEKLLDEWLGKSVSHASYLPPKTKKK